MLPFLLLERIEVRGSFVYLVYLVMNKGIGCNINKNGHREGGARGDLRFPSFSCHEAGFPESESQTKIATSAWPPRNDLSFYRFCRSDSPALRLVDLAPAFYP